VWSRGVTDRGLFEHMDSCDQAANFDCKLKISSWTYVLITSMDMSCSETLETSDCCLSTVRGLR
jgi:hypothetical protein